jgi:adenylate cyclase class 2
MEIEVKFRIFEDKKDIIKEILTKGFEKTKQSHQKDVYYLSGKKIAGKNLYLRTREDFLKNTFSYDLHEVISDLSTKETELEVRSKKDLDKLDYITETLGFKKLVVVDKKRMCLRKNDLTLVFDHVEGLGDFIEIEVEGNNEQEALVIIKKYQKILNLKNINKITEKGYPDLILQKKQ